MKSKVVKRLKDIEVLYKEKIKECIWDKTKNDIGLEEKMIDKELSSRNKLKKYGKMVKLGKEKMKCKIINENKFVNFRNYNNNDDEEELLFYKVKRETNRDKKINL